MVTEALEKIGAARSIVIDEAGVVLAGNGVREAAIAAGISKVRIVDTDRDTMIAVRRSGLTPAEKRALAIYDNRTAELAEWNVPQLQADLAAGLTLEPWFAEDELGALLKAAPGGRTPPDQVPPLRATSITRGALFQLGRHRLLCGDATRPAEVAAVMDGARAGLVLTDPPYGYNQPGVPGDAPENLEALLRGTVAALPAGDAVLVAFQSPRTFPLLLDELRAGGWTFERMLWFYKTAQMANQWRGWIIKSDAIAVYSRGQPAWLDVHPYQHDVYSVTELNHELPAGIGWHGSVKPAAVVRDVMSRIGGTVFDPFLGSGTTLVAAEQIGRRCCGMELEPAYCQVIVDRWEAFTGARAEKLGELMS